MRAALAEVVRPAKYSAWSRLWQKESYDRSPDLTSEERAEVRRLTHQGLQSRCWFKLSRTKLERLLRPVRDLVRANRADSTIEASVMKVLITEMSRRQASFWGWTSQQWEETLRPTLGAFQNRYETRTHARPLLLALSLVCGGLNDPRRLGPFSRVVLARTLFGRSQLDRSIQRVQTVLRGWGYSVSDVTTHRLTTRLCEALVINKSPHLEDLTLKLLEEMRSTHGQDGRAVFHRLSRALVHLGMLDKPLDPALHRPPTAAPADLTASVGAEWLDYLDRWQATSTLEPRTRKDVYWLAMKAGRWVAKTRPEATSPAAWTQDIAAQYVAAVRRMNVGDWAIHMNKHAAVGKPLTAKAQAGHLGALRVFFRDCQEWEWIPRRFNPARCLALPPSVRNLIGPNPRVIADDIWAKLVWSGLNLSVSDLASSYKGIRSFYPLEMAKAAAMLWLFSGLRSDEIHRLRVGCIRWQQAFPDKHTKSPPKKICLLDVPVNKTSTAFSKPVDPVVGQFVDGWERVRPTQPAQLDSKTGEMVHFLFAFRGRRVSRRYINRILIGHLCRKAAVPLSDARGRITSHRARATIASQLLNAKQPMTLADLQEWLGHRSVQSTRYYAKISPTRLVKSYLEADYFTRNLRSIDVLIDQEAVRTRIADDTPWKFYDLGHGYCTYDFFDQCPHRMACPKCSFYRPKGSTEAQLLEGKANLLRMRQEIPLGENEIGAVEDGVAALETLIHKLADIPTPAGPTPRQLQASSLVQLTALPPAPSERRK